MVLHRVKTYSSDPGGSILLFSWTQTIYNSHLCSKKILWNIAQFWNKRTVKVTVGFAHKSGDKLIWSELVENVLRVSLSAWVLSVGKEKKNWVIFPNSSIGNKFYATTAVFQRTRAESIASLSFVTSHISRISEEQNSFVPENQSLIVVRGGPGLV